MQSKLWMESIVRVINELGGYFTFNSGGEEFVVVKKDEFEALKTHSNEMQLELPDSRNANNVPMTRVEDANRDIALSQGEPEVDNELLGIEDDNSVGLMESENEISSNRVEPASFPIEEPHEEIRSAESNDDSNKPPVRFESIKGDLSPDLQE